MTADRRKALLQAYKDERKPIGVFAVKCPDQAWVGASRNLDKQQNGLWFTLRLGSHPDRRLQGAWKQHGEAAFAYEVLEVIDDDGLSPYETANALKDRAAAWRVKLQAATLF